MTCEQKAIFELDIEIDGSKENDFYFNYLTIDTNEDDFELSDAPEELIVENIEFKEDVSLVFYETVPLPTLQQLAAFVAAIESWRHVMRSENLNRITYLYPAIDFLFKESKDVEEFLQQLPLPGSIRELIRICLDPFQEEIVEWMRYFQCLILKPLKISDLTYCVWLSEGKIDRRKTALNMLSNPEMNIFDRFKIMSEYCLEDEIKKMTLNSIPERFIRRITFEKTPLRYYWLCYMNNNFEKFPIKNGQSVEAFMICTFLLKTWSAVEYFWNRLNINEQISAALIILAGEPYFPNIQRQLFSKMNQFQKHHVLSTIPSYVAMNFYYEELYELAFLTVVQFGNVLTFEDFSDLIIRLLDHCRCFGVAQSDALFYLAKIWNYLSVDYKNRGLQSMTEDVIHMHSIFFYRRNNIPKLMKSDFLVAFLSSGSVDFRRNIIFNHGAGFVFTCEPSGVHQLIRSCDPDTKDLVLFEKYLLNSDDIKSNCSDMLKERFGDRKQLAEFLNNYISNSDDKIKFISRIVLLAENDSGDPMKQWNNAIEFIDSYFETASSYQIIKYKRRIVWSFVNIHPQCRYDYKQLDQFIQTIAQVLEGDLLERYKKVALKRFQGQCRWVKFDKIKIHQFLLWCLNYDYVKMRYFVKSLSIERIFWRAWEDMKQAWGLFFEVEQSRQTISETLAPIDKLLLWYFVKSDCVKKFKLEKVFGFRDRKSAMFGKSNDNAVQEVFIRNVLPWFFDGDLEQVRKFKELFRKDNIVKLINID